MNNKKCIEHNWVQGNRHIPTVMKYGSLSRAIWVCKDCGKRRVF